MALLNFKAHRLRL